MAESSTNLSSSSYEGGKSKVGLTRLESRYGQAWFLLEPLGEALLPSLFQLPHLLDCDAFLHLQSKQHRICLSL